jgi:phosphatidylglycerophosphatase A
VSEAGDKRNLLVRWSPAIFWTTTSAALIALLEHYDVGAALFIVALPALLGLVLVRRDRLRSLGLQPWSPYRLAADLSTSGSAGFAPVGSGTFGAIAALPLGFFLARIDWPIRAAILVAGTGLSLVATRYYLVVKRRAMSQDGVSTEETPHHKDLDPSEVVIDESIGVLLALAFVPWSIVWSSAAFVLFRAFDITKPGPVGWAERRLRGEWSVVMDDVVAGLLAGIVLALARWLPTLL